MSLLSTLVAFIIASPAAIAMHAVPRRHVWVHTYLWVTLLQPPESVMPLVELLPAAQALDCWDALRVLNDGSPPRGDTVEE